MGAGGPDGGWGSKDRRCNGESQMEQDSGGQKGQMAGHGWAGGDDRETDGAEAVGAKKDQMAREGEDGRMQEGQMAVVGVVREVGIWEKAGFQYGGIQLADQGVRGS